MDVAKAFQTIADATDWSATDLEMVIAACGEGRERERTINLARWKVRGYSGKVVVNLNQGHITDVRMETSDVALERALTSSGIKV